VTVQARIRATVLHCSGTHDGQKLSLEWLDKRHREQGRAGIGYHLVIQPDGKVHKTREFNQRGAHCAEPEGNLNTVGICIVGGIGISGDGASEGLPHDPDGFAWMGPRQEHSLLVWLSVLQLAFGTHPIVGHWQYQENGTCPRFNVDAWLHEHQLVHLTVSHGTDPSALLHTPGRSL
jgi:hypothetical protein